MLILLMLFYGLSCGHASCINGEARAELPSPYEGSCPPRNPMECAFFFGLDHGIGDFMLVEVDSEAQAAVPPIPKSR